MTETFDASFMRDNFNLESASTLLSQEAFAMPSGNSLQTLALVGGGGFVGGAATTAAGEFAMMKTVEPFAKTFGALAFGAIGGGRAAGAILSAPPLTALECITPKAVLIGGAITAGLAIGAYELYENFHKS